MSEILFSSSFFFFFFNDTATTEIYTLSLHDALPICGRALPHTERDRSDAATHPADPLRAGHRSEEHTSELQSPDHLVCRLLLEKTKRGRRRATASTASRARPRSPRWSARSSPFFF